LSSGKAVTRIEEIVLEGQVLRIGHPKFSPVGDTFSGCPLLRSLDHAFGNGHADAPAAVFPGKEGRSHARTTANVQDIAILTDSA